MVRKGKLAVFEGSSISKIREGTSTKIGVYAFDINPYLHEFFEPIPVDQIFDDHGLYIVHGQKAVFEGSSISETREGTSTKIGVYAFDINAYLHEFLKLIPID